MRIFLTALLSLAVLPVCSYAVDGDTSGVIDFVLPFHWEHARPLVAVEGEVAVDRHVSAWRAKPDQAWLRYHVAAYAADFASQFTQLQTADAPLDARWPGRVSQVDLSRYKVGDSYDWPSLRRRYPATNAIIEVTQPVFSLDGRVAIVGYFSVEPEQTHQYFTAVRLNAENEWEWVVTSATRLRQTAP